MEGGLLSQSRLVKTPTFPSRISLLCPIVLTLTISQQKREKLFKHDAATAVLYSDDGVPTNGSTGLESLVPAKYFPLQGVFPVHSPMKSSSAAYRPSSE